MTGRNPSLILTIEMVWDLVLCCQVQVHTNRFYIKLLQHQPPAILQSDLEFSILYFVLHQIFRLEYVSEIPGYLEDKKLTFSPVMLCYVNNNM